MKQTKYNVQHCDEACGKSAWDSGSGRNFPHFPLSARDVPG
jgi:hypothetical protein